jgi:hypothetical protein
LTTEFQNRVTLEKDKWHVKGHPDGACLLKVVISLAYIDTKITSSNFDIKKFNGWVKGQVAALAARGETTSDLIVNLFKGYEAVPDRVFKDYIKQKKSAYEEGGTINPEELMQLAQNKFEGRVLAKTWNAPTGEQEQIIALEAHIERLQEKKRNLAKRKPQGPRSAQQKNSNSQQKKKPTGNKKKDGRRVEVRPKDIPKLGVIIPSTIDGEPLIAFPLVLPMGWKNSPPYFCAFTETVADVTNERIRCHQQPPRHRMDRVAESQPEPDTSAQVTVLPDAQATRQSNTAVPAPISPPIDPRAGPSTHQHLNRQQPFGKFDIYVDDFLATAQGKARRRNRLRRILFHTLDEVLRPKDQDDCDAQEPISLKKLRKGDAKWSTTKQMMGWLIDTIQSTITLPPHRLERLHTILASITPDQHQVSIKKWQQMLGELRAMAIAIPGARGIFSHLQAALQARNLTQGRIRVSNHVRATLDDFTWLANALEDRPTRLQELVAQPPCLLPYARRSMVEVEYFVLFLSLLV